MARLLILFALLPYFRSSPLATDVQPHFFLALLVYLFIFISQKRYLPLHWSSVFIGGYLGSIYFVLGGGLQSIALFLLPVSVDLLSGFSRKDMLWALKMATAILFFGIVLQLLNSPVLSILVSNQRVSIQRGFTSFTSEPSYLGILGYFISVAFLIFKAGYRWVIAAVALVVLSASATALVPLVVVFGVYFLRGWRLLFLPLGGAALYFAIGFVAQTDTRIGGLVNMALDSPALLLLDVSVSNRIIRAFGPLYAAASDFFVPHARFEQLDIGFAFTAAKADTSVSKLSNIASVFIYSFGFLILPVIWAYFRHARAPLFYWVSLLLIVLLNLSATTPYVFLAISLPVFLYKNTDREMPENRVENPATALKR